MVRGAGRLARPDEAHVQAFGQHGRLCFAALKFQQTTVECGCHVYSAPELTLRMVVGGHGYSVAQRLVHDTTESTEERRAHRSARTDAELVASLIESAAIGDDTATGG